MQQSTTKTEKPQPLKSSALLVAFGILLSRISGLIRERVFAHYLGNSEAAGAFKAALRIPNFLQNLFGEGVLSASFIPIYSRLLSQGQDELADEMAGVVGAILAVFVSALVLIGVLLTPFFVELVAPGFSGETLVLTISIVRVLFPGIGLLVLSAWCLGILNSHRKFFISYVAPVFWNGAMIAALLYMGASALQDQLAIGVAWGALAGSFLQLGIQVPYVLRVAKKLKFKINLDLKFVRDVFRNALPIFIGRGVVQLSAYVDGMLASFLGAGSVACLAYAQTIYLLPVSLFGMSISAAELPEMSRTAEQTPEAREKLAARLVTSQKRIAFFVIPSVIAFIVMGSDVVAALYQTGQFGHEDTLYVWYVLMGSSIGLLASTWGRLFSSAFYAMQDTKTPLKFALIRVTLTGALGWLFAFPLRPHILYFLFSVIGFRHPGLVNVDLGLGAVGLTASAGIAGWIEFLLLRHSLHKKIKGLSISGMYLFKIWMCALVASAFAALVKWFEFLYHMPRFLRELGTYNLLPIYALIIYGVLYLAFCWVFKVSEVSLLRRFMRK
jgi:putative peptidoglycan lipid II flippase